MTKFFLFLIYGGYKSERKKDVVKLYAFGLINGK
jgi:hypothetical protein